MTALLFLAIPTLPYQDVTLPDGSAVSYVVDCGDPNRGAVGPFEFRAQPVPSGLFQQALVKDDKGWNDANLKVVDGQLQTTRHNDPLWPIAAPWYVSGVWMPAWVRTWHRAPYGASNNEVWPAKPALRVATNRSKLYVTVNGSPCESFYLSGNDNDVTVFVRSGEQSRLKSPNNRTSGARSPL